MQGAIKLSASPNYWLSPIISDLVAALRNARRPKKSLAAQVKSVFMETTMERKKKQVSETPWMKSEEAAEYLGVCVGTIRNWVCQKHIPFVRRGRVVRFRRDDLDKWLRDGGTQ